MNTEPRYRIHAVAEMTGVPAPTLRAWERRYGIPRPGRSESSYRLYSDADVAEVRHLVVLQTRGLAPSEAARLLLEGGAPPVERPAAPEPARANPDPFASARDRMLARVMAFDQAGLEQESHAALYLGAPRTVYREVIAPVLVEMGLRWERGELDVAGEHLASRVIGAALSDLTGTLTRGSRGAPVLLACVADDQHDLPLYGVGLTVLDVGFRPAILGQRTPPEAIATAVLRIAPRAVCLSMTVSPAGDVDVGLLFHRYAAACAGLPWIVGGAAVPRFAGVIRAAGGEVVDSVDELRRKLDSLHRRASRVVSSSEEDLPA